MTNNKYLRKIIVFLSIIIPGLLLVLFHRITPFIFQTNDDVFLNAIVSGEITGTPNPRMIHVGYPTGLLLSALYRIFPTLPWYGLFLCASFGITMAVILSLLVKRSKKVWSQFLTILFFSIGVYSFFFMHVSQLQFTFVTTFIGAGAIFSLIFFEPDDSLQNCIKECLGLILLSALSCSIRNTACIILLPFAGMVFLSKYIYTGQSALQPIHNIFTFSKKRKNLISVAFIYIGVLALICGIQCISNSSNEWSDYIRFSQSRAKVVDYAGFPEYDLHENLYQEMGITKASYESLRNHYGIIFESNLTSDNMAVLATLSGEEAKQALPSFSIKIQQMVSQFIERHLDYADRPLNLLVYAFYLCFFICAVIGKNRQASFEILLTGIARMVIWTYLMYINRYPIRVTQGVYATELFLLLGIAWKNRIWEGNVRKTATRITWYLTAVIFIFLCFRFGIPKANGIKYESRGRLTFSQSYIDMKDYFKAHPENFYYLDANSFGNFTKEALAGGREEYGNFMFTGSWLPQSPLYDEKLRKEGITDVAAALFEDPHIYVVFMDSEITGYEYLEKLYREDYGGRVLKNVEDVTTSNGLVFHIMKVYNPE